MTGVCVYGLRMFVDAMHAYLSVCVCVCQCVAVGVCVCICSSMCMFVHTGFVCVCRRTSDTTFTGFLLSRPLSSVLTSPSFLIPAHGILFSRMSLNTSVSQPAPASSPSHDAPVHPQADDDQ